MCQTHSKIVRKESVKCYRAYEKDDDGYLASLPKMGVLTQALYGPFHAFATKQDINKWIKSKIFDSHVVIFECMLLTTPSDRIKSGNWSGNGNVKTYTGGAVILVRKVAWSRRNSFKLRWYKTA
jgi:hypothetical protein